MPIVVPGAIEVTIRGQWSNTHNVDNVLALVDDATDPSTQARDLLNAWQNYVMDVICNNYTLLGCTWVDLSSLAGETGFLSPNSSDPTQGAVGGAAPPPNVATIVRKITGSARGTRNGRIYLAPGDENSYDENGMLDNDFRNAVDSAFASLQNIDGVDMGVIHAPAGGAYSITSVGAYQTDPMAGTQRRRLR